MPAPQPPASCSLPPHASFPPRAGHSLGGALCQLAAYTLQQAYPGAETAVVTFGAPRVRFGGVGVCGGGAATPVRLARARLRLRLLC